MGEPWLHLRNGFKLTVTKCVLLRCGRTSGPEAPYFMNQSAPCFTSRITPENLRTIRILRGGSHWFTWRFTSVSRAIWNGELRCLRRGLRPFNTKHEELRGFYVGDHSLYFLRSLSKGSLSLPALWVSLVPFKGWSVILSAVIKCQSCQLLEQRYGTRIKSGIPQGRATARQGDTACQ